MAESDYIFEGGKAWLKTRAGTVLHLDKDAALSMVGSGEAQAASSDDVKAWKKDRDYQTEEAKAFVEGAASGAIDAAVAPGKYATAASRAINKGIEQGVRDVAGDFAGDVYGSTVNPFGAGDAAADLIGKTGGRQVLRDIARIGGTAAEQFTEGPAEGEYQRTGVGFGEEYDDAARLRARDNRFASGAGRMLGEVGVGLGLGAVGAGATSIAGLAAQGALEGALGGASQASEDAWIADKEVTTDALIWSAGLGGVLGAGAGAGMGVLGKAGKAVSDDILGGLASRAGKSLGDDVAGLGDDIGDLADDGYRGAAKAKDVVDETFPGSKIGEPTVEEAKEVFRSTAQRMGFEDDAEAMASYRYGGGGDVGYQARRVAAGQEVAVLDDYGGQLTKQLKSLYNDGASEILKASEYAEAKARRLAPHVQGNLGAQKAGAAAQADHMYNAYEIAMKSIQAEDPAIGQTVKAQFSAGGLEKEFKAQRVLLDRALASAENPGQVAMALDKFKRASGKYIARANERVEQAFSGGAGKEVSETAIGHLKAGYESVRQHLQDASIWGRTWADGQTEINKGFTQVLDDHPFVSRRLREYVGNADVTGDGWSTKQYDVTSRRVNSLLKSVIGDTQDEVEGNIVPRYFRNLANLAESAEKYGVAEGSTKAVKETAELFDEAVHVARVGRRIKAIEGETEGGLVSEMLGGIPVAGPLLKRVKGVYDRPGGFFSWVESQVGRFDSDFRKAVTSTMGEASDAVRGSAKKAKETGSKLGAQDFFKGGESKQSAYRRVLGALSKLANDEEVQTRLARGLGEVADRAPSLATTVAARASSALAYLNEQAPGMDKTSLFQPSKDGKVVATDREIVKFARKFQAVSNPKSVLKLLEKGKLTRDHVEAIQAVYPELYNRMQVVTLETLRERGDDVPYGARRKLDLLLNLNGLGEPTMAPSFGVAMTSAALQVAQSKVQQSRPPSRQSAPKVAELSQSGTADLDDKE